MITHADGDITAPGDVEFLKPCLAMSGIVGIEGAVGVEFSGKRKRLVTDGHGWQVGNLVIPAARHGDIHCEVIHVFCGPWSHRTPSTRGSYHLAPRTPVEGLKV